jgi:hypothetical protein
MHATPMTQRPATSHLLNNLLVGAPADQVTLAWLMESLGDRSFGIVMIVLALLALLPGVSAFVGVLLAIPAFQMIRAQHSPVFPKRLASRPFPTRALGKVLRGIIPALRWLEQFIHPRWATPFETTKRIVGAIVLLMGGLLLAPVPLSNLAPALIIFLIAIAYLQEDGVLLCIALVAAVLVLAVAAGAVWETVSAIGWVPSFLS